MTTHSTGNGASAVSPLDRLVIIEEIRQLKAAYFRTMDLKLWDELETLFTPDATFDARGALELPKPDADYTEPVIQGARAIRDYIQTGLSPLTSVHFGHMPEIHVITATTASAIWPMEDLLVPPPGGPFKSFRGWGHYRETYECAGGRWRIASLRLRRLHVETIV